jgi:2-phospho-L-lactate guanylyltransferase (CobY/MobA/RfbA family)
MTIAVVPAEPPVADVPLPGLASTALDGDDRARLYRAMLADVCQAIQESGVDLLVNYRPADQVDADVDSERALRDALRDLLPEPDAARYEVQVGETYHGRVGNSVTHLLEEEGASSVTVVDPRTALLKRADVGQATLKLRSTNVVLGPGPGGRVYVAGFDESIDFTEAFETPALGTLTERALDAGLDVDFLPTQPVVETERDLVDVVAETRARRLAERHGPPATTAMVEELGLRVSADGTVATSDNS